MATVMVLLFLAILAVLGLLAVVAFLLGYRLGSDQWQSRLVRIRLESARAERDLHDLTRSAFEAMVDRARDRTNRR